MKIDLQKLMDFLLDEAERSSDTISYFKGIKEPLTSQSDKWKSVEECLQREIGAHGTFNRLIYKFKDCLDIENKLT